MGKKATITVPKQWSYIGRKLVISSTLANTHLTVRALLRILNAILGTLYTLRTACIRSTFEDFISKRYDLGTAYASLSPFWYIGLTAVVATLSSTKCRTKRCGKMHSAIKSSTQMSPLDVSEVCIVIGWYRGGFLDERGGCGMSHAWMDKEYREDVITPINGHVHST
ncbi:uncharacterized protein EV420DRAFT_1193774 [Desarmillaria tabescens]|uniref:Uncharacterized protein n=1 Tax=Armillaria tabescens TaxID=1929756 RepID=A0AA39NBE8_ARMTA|nr:uncharacterized protein EV420DRAFT_1193774 [Desarmillaria tabescens]KAK0462528.1 hypothetical protein EV420DRAFT_1193774 [Desarmillaria tabescens]